MVQRVTTNDNQCYNGWQGVTTNDNEWQRVVQQVTTSDNEWQQVIQRVTTSDNRWHRMTRSDNEWEFWPNFLFSNNMVLVWAVLHFITLEVTVDSSNRCIQNLCKFFKEYCCGISWTFNELFAFYHKNVLLLFRWKTDVLFCIIKRRSS